MVRTALAERLGRPRLRKLRHDSEQPDAAMFARRRARHATDDRRCGPWQFTALYSNSRRAHEFGRTRDWVVIAFHRDDTPEYQCTVVTERQGPRASRRVIRGGESECGELPG